MQNKLPFLFACVLTTVPLGCVVGPQMGAAPMVQQEPIFVPTANTSRVWDQTVQLLNDYHFTIARENRLEGVIETNYKPGAGILEPWHQDAPDLASRWEGTLQSIRRRVVVTMQPAGDGGSFLVFRVDKEIEDLPGLASNSVGAATFQENQVLQRDLNNVVGQAVPSQWLPRGRDLYLERVLQNSLRDVLMQQ